MDPETGSTQGNGACPTCAGLGETIEIENAQDPAEGEEAEGFPPEADALQAPNEALEQTYRYGNERLLKCPDCGTYYGYRKWAPGGSEDVQHTYIHEAIRRLGFLEAHVELRDVLYQAHRRAREYGGSYQAAYELARRGVEAELSLLRARHGEIIAEVIDQLRNKYARSEELAELLALISPDRDHSDQVEEARENDQARAAYHASILAEYLGYAQASGLPGLVRRVSSLLVDDVPRVRQIVRDALLRLLDEGTEQEGTLARELAEAAKALTPRYDELEELVAACQGALQPPAST